MRGGDARKGGAAAGALARMLADHQRAEIAWRDRGLARLRWHVVEQPDFSWSHLEGGTLPRSHQWRPYRYCVQDVVLGLTVVRHAREYNGLEVDVFLSTKIPEYDPLTGPTALALLLLSESYQSGGSMEIRFTREVEDGCVPHALVSLALAFGIRFERVRDGVIAPREARNLYAALTGFSSDLRARTETLEIDGRVSMTQVCHAVHRGVWDRVEVEAIVRASPRPGNVFGGGGPPEHRHLHLQAIHDGRAALLLGSLDRALRYRSHPGTHGTVHLEDDERALEVDIDGTAWTATYRCADELHLPWSDGPDSIPAGVPLTVVVRAHDAVGWSEGDIDRDVDVVARLMDKGQVRMLVTRDAASAGWLRDRLGQVRRLVYPGVVRSLDAEVSRRLRLGQGMRT